MSNGFALSTGFLPSPVDPRPELNNATPSVRPHYRALFPTTGRSAPVPRLDTLILMGATHLDFSLRIWATGSHIPCKSPAHEAELIRRVASRLARYPSIYGHDFSRAPPLLHRLSDYCTYLRPPGCGATRIGLNGPYLHANGPAILRHHTKRPSFP